MQRQDRADRMAVKPRVGLKLGQLKLCNLRAPAHIAHGSHHRRFLAKHGDVLPKAAVEKRVLTVWHGGPVGSLSFTRVGQDMLQPKSRVNIFSGCTAQSATPLAPANPLTASRPPAQAVPGGARAAQETSGTSWKLAQDHVAYACVACIGLEPGRATSRNTQHQISVIPRVHVRRIRFLRHFLQGAQVFASQA